MLACVLATLQDVSAQLASAWLSRDWQSDNGLPDNSVLGVAQTPDGYLWIGTPTGLVRFDGQHFDLLSLTNIIAPPNRGVVTMLPGANGALWLGMDRGGVVCLKGDTSRSFTEGLPNFIPYDLAEDHEGSCWVSYRDGSVYQIQGDKILRISEGQNLPNGEDNCALAADKQGQIWFAKSGHVGVFRKGTFQTLFRPAAQPMHLAPAVGGGVWLCVGHRLFKCKSTDEIQDLGEFNPKGTRTTVTCMLEDHEGAVWIGTSFSGLFRRAAAGFEAVATSHQGIASLAEDNEGNIWVGTSGGGLDRIRRRAITLLSGEDGLPFPAVLSICEDRDGVVWAATQNGVLTCWKDGNWSALSTNSQWPGDATCVAADARGAVWIGTHTRGLFCYREGRFVDWGDARTLDGKTLHTLLPDRNGDLWIGQESPPAIFQLHAGKLKSYPVPPDVRVIRAMAEDKDGNIWAGTSKGVLLRVANGTLEDVTPRADADLASIRCLYATPDGAVWIGFAGWGVGVLKDGKYAEINSERGLFDDYISHIVSDGRGWLWFSSNRGIFKVRQGDLEAVAMNQAPWVRSVHYGRGEGLPSMQGTFGDAPDVLRGRDGRLWLPMQTALAVADPSRLYENTNPPPVLLTRVLVDGRPVAGYGCVVPAVAPQGNPMTDLAGKNVKLNLLPSHRKIEIDFTALSFTAPENVRLQYRMVGVDREWMSVEADMPRTAIYSRLSDGKYRFEVRACNSEGIWSEQGASLQFRVTPFFYNTWWFHLVLGGAFTLSVIGIVRYVSFRRLRRRLRLLEQQDALHRERARIAKDIHDDLGASLTQIALLGELARQDRAEPDKASERTEKISMTARHAIKSLDEIVWAVNPRNDTLAHLIDYVGQHALDYLRVADVRCRLDLPEQVPGREVSTDTRHNLFLAVKEALTNIVKHAQATEVWLRISVNDEGLRVVIEDNGRGFGTLPSDPGADGLRNMQQRLAMVGGVCRIHSQPGAGTRVSFEVPWARS